MTPAPTTGYSRTVLRSAVMAAEASSWVLSWLRAQLMQVPCTPTDVITDVRTFAYSLPRGDSRWSAEPMYGVDRPLALRYLPPL